MIEWIKNLIKKPISTINTVAIYGSIDDFEYYRRIVWKQLENTSYATGTELTNLQNEIIAELDRLNIGLLLK
jgi:hypothetical protein